MDSLTQLTLGAAVGDALMGKKSGRKAAVWGAFLGTFPDLDVLIPMGGAVEDFVYHRSFSHSMFILALLTSVWLWIFLKFHPKERSRWRGWVLMIYAVFLTHIGIDAVTVYGTQVFWPITNYPVSIGSFFIIDPIYTLPLLVGCILYLVFRKGGFGRNANFVGLAISTVYIFVAIGVQSFVRGYAEASLKRQSLPHENLLVIPTPFNTVLWRLVTMDKDGYHVGYYSLLDPEGEIKFNKILNDNQMVADFEGYKRFELLKWFSHGFYSLDYEDENQSWVMSDLRMGVEPEYVFRFIVATSLTKTDEWQAVEPIQLPRSMSFDRLGLIWDRIFDPDVRVGGS